jgi:hypothetical protein
VKIPVVGNLDIKSLVVGAAIFWALDTFVLKEALTGRAYIGETQNTLNWTGTPGQYDLS